MPVRAVVFDVDFTIARPGPDLGPEGYRRLGERFGLALDPTRYERARAAALAELERHPELDHDEEIWILFTQRIIEGMGGIGGRTYDAAVAMERAWLHAHHFELYDDVLPTLDALRERGVKIGLLSNSARDLSEFVAHHGLQVDAVLTSRTHGKTKPHETIFRQILALLDVPAEEALMVGDTLEDDVEGARAVGMQAVLVDREGRRGLADALDDLRAVVALLGVRG
ncbi:MAG TPA: HAD family hydrolase [Gaiellaceae bacterium]|nr:HAD family hydrolase [Gaiellaceae bacterium]